MYPSLVSRTRSTNLFGRHYRDRRLGRDGYMVDFVLVILQTPPESLEEEHC